MRVLFRKDVDGSSGDVYYEQYAGLSSETKPTMNIATGSEFFEVDTGKKYKFDELTNSWIEQPDLKSAIHQVTPEQFGAKGDGVTDDSQAVQDAVDAGYDVYFASNKTYYLASAVTVDHDCHLFGGENTIIKTKTPTGGTAPDGIKVEGTLKKTTTLTTDYLSVGNTNNCSNRFTLTDMNGINIGDLLVIVATDQYYSYARQYYYLGATLLVTDIYDGHIFTSEGMPFDIENTENVSVKVYSAPVVTIEKLNFVSDLDSRGSYKYLLLIERCKNSNIKDCTFTQMDNGIMLHECVNMLVTNVSLSKSKYDNNLQGDGYGIAIYSCTDTIIERVLATCAQHAITVSGQEPSLNTRVRFCDLTAECRAPGLDTHENSWNLVVEDCVLGTAAVHGTAVFNRCRIISNRRFGNDVTYIALNGSHDPQRAMFKIMDCTFEGTGINLPPHSTQSPIQSFDNVYGSIVIENCTGGAGVVFTPAQSESILSNKVMELIIKNCKNLREIFYNGNNPIDFMRISDTTFEEPTFINDHVSAHGMLTNGIKRLEVSNVSPVINGLSVDIGTPAERYYMPKDVQIQLTADNPDAVFRVCGKNLTPNEKNDFRIGSVTGTAGGTLTRTVYTGDNVSLDVDENGNPVYTQSGNSTSKYSFYPVGMFVSDKGTRVTISAKLKNTGETNGSTFSPVIAVVDYETGLIIKRTTGTATAATAEGTVAEYYLNIDKKSVVLCYFYCSSPVAGAETTFENFKISLTSAFNNPVVEDEYASKRITGNGTILSLEGINNIMCSEDSFRIKFMYDDC